MRSNNASAAFMCASPEENCRPFYDIAASLGQYPQLRFDRSARAIRRDPCEVRKLVAEPRGLPFGVLPRFKLGTLDCVGKGNLARQMPNEPGYTVRLHRRQVRVELARRKRAHLVHGACRDHGIEARADAA